MELHVAVVNGITVMAGKSFEIPAIAAGRPFPEISWTKDMGKELSERARVKNTDQGMLYIICTLNVHLYH